MYMGVFASVFAGQKYIIAYIFAQYLPYEHFCLFIRSREVQAIPFLEFLVYDKQWDYVFAGSFGEVCILWRRGSSPGEWRWR